jgi:hypothetical protein
VQRGDGAGIGPIQNHPAIQFFEKQNAFPNLFASDLANVNACDGQHSFVTDPVADVERLQVGTRA